MRETPIGSVNAVGDFNEGRFPGCGQDEKQTGIGHKGRNDVEMQQYFGEEEQIGDGMMKIKVFRVRRI